jgi:hypothetical protein
MFVRAVQPLRLPATFSGKATLEASILFRLTIANPPPQFRSPAPDSGLKKFNSRLVAPTKGIFFCKVECQPFLPDGTGLSVDTRSLICRLLRCDSVQPQHRDARSNPRRHLADSRPSNRRANRRLFFAVARVRP